MNNIIGKTWRDSATLIVINKQIRDLRHKNQKVANYDMLLQTRTNRGTYQNTAVFPGGVVEPADSSDEWKELFKLFGFKQHNFDSFHRADSSVPPIFQNDPIRRNIAFRIAAIRETFEELGFLLCSREHCGSKTSDLASVISEIDARYWRNKVSEDPKQLLTLCKEHQCYPDIWRLHYWSSWLTPLSLKKRFNAAFFVTALERKPDNIEGNVEVSDVQWCDPIETLKKSAKKEVKLPPPQAYELSRITQLKDVEDIINFAKAGNTISDELFYPVFVRAKDGVLHLLPGDDLYPTKLNYLNDTINIKDKTVAELREGSHTVHRSEAVEGRTEFIINNYKPKNNHIDMGEKTILFYNN